MQCHCESDPLLKHSGLGPACRVSDIAMECPQRTSNGYRSPDFLDTSYRASSLDLLVYCIFQPNSNIVDLVQLMLFSSAKGGQKSMTSREIVAQSMTFLLAGYETSSAVLGYIGHLLAGDAQVQNLLIQEIDEKLGAVSIGRLCVVVYKNWLCLTLPPLFSMPSS